MSEHELSPLSEKIIAGLERDRAAAEAKWKAAREQQRADLAAVRRIDKMLRLARGAPRIDPRAERSARVPLAGTLMAMAIDFLRDSGQPWLLWTMAERMGVNYDSLQSTISRGKGVGFFVKLADGRFDLGPNAPGGPRQIVIEAAPFCALCPHGAEAHDDAGLCEMPDCACVGAPFDGAPAGADVERFMSGDAPESPDEVTP